MQGLMRRTPVCFARGDVYGNRMYEYARDRIILHLV